MKKTTNYLKTLIFIFLMGALEICLAQPCSVTLTTVMGLNGNVTFIASPLTGTNSTSTFTWNYGNGVTVTATGSTTSVYQYTANGAYVASVTFSNPTSGCSASASRTVVVTNGNGCNLIAGFVWNYSNTNGLINFNSTSQYTTTGATYSWNFGDGSPNGSGASPSHTYSTTATSYSVTMIVNNNTGSVTCIDTIGYNIWICGLSSSMTSTTNANGSVGFTGNAVGTTSNVSYYNWNFGDNSPSVTGSVVSTPGSSSQIQSHTYLANGTYTVTLNITSGQCVIGTQYTLNVGNVTAPCGLVASFGLQGLSNGLVNFTNNSSNASPGVTYAWNFGDGGSSTLINPSHTYTANGNYTVTLVANNNYSYACTSTFANAYVNVYSVCNLAAGFNSSIGANGGVSFANTTTGTTPGTTTCTWNFGDGSPTSSINSPAHTFANGTYTVTLIESNFLGGPGTCTNSLSQVITVTTCIADASFSMTPTATPQFWNAYPLNPGNIIAASWNWGDNSSSNTLYTAHNYSAAGTYSICLTVTVNCGSINQYCMPYAIYRPSGTNQNLDVIQVTVIDPATVGIKNSGADKSFYTISPNPNNGSFNLTMKGLNSGIKNISIYNIVGKLVYQEDIEIGNSSMIREIQMDDVSNGVYFVKVNSNNKVFTQKLIINRQ